MEPEPAKATAEHENETKPELINKKDINDTNKQPPDTNTPSRLSSSSSSASSRISLEFGADENDLLSAPDDPWSMLSTSEPEPSTGSNGNGYDPNRIPSSIFSATSRADCWSSLSNESLFSIHMGNNSFSRDLAILCEKSGELGRADDWTNEHELMISTGGLTTVSEETSGGGVSRVDSFNNKGPHLASSMSLSMPRLSNESGNSCASFAFPVLVGDGVKGSGSSRKGVTTTMEKRGTEEVCSMPVTPQQGPGPGEQGGGNWYSRWCCCCCCWPSRCC